MRRRDFLTKLGSCTIYANLPWLASCVPERSMVIATNPWIGYETLYLARDFKWLPKAVELRDLKTASNSLSALQTGQAQAACLTLDEMLLGRAMGLPLSIVLVFDSSAGGDMVLGRPGINKLEELAGKRIGFEKSGVGALVFQQLLVAAHLPSSALTVFNLPPDRQLDAWRKYEVDAVITYEPSATLLRREGAQRLFDSRQMPEMIFDVLAIRRDQTPKLSLIKALVASHFRALYHLRTQTDDAIFRISGRLGFSPEETQIALQGLSRPTFAVNRSYLIGKDTHLIQAARTISNLMVQSGLLAQQDNLEQLILPDTLPEEDSVRP
jgi:NitT/TauT family transport system substrate-binding protein